MLKVPTTIAFVKISTTWSWDNEVLPLIVYLLRILWVPSSIISSIIYVIPYNKNCSDLEEHQSKASTQ